MIHMWKHLFTDEEVEFWTRAFNQLGKTKMTHSIFINEVLIRLGAKER